MIKFNENGCINVACSEKSIVVSPISKDPYNVAVACVKSDRLREGERKTIVLLLGQYYCGVAAPRRELVSVLETLDIYIE